MVQSLLATGLLVLIVADITAHVSRRVYAVPLRDVRSLGPEPIAIDLRVWDGSRIEVATERCGRLNLVGPFLAAAVSALPTAPNR
jgi:hypothetical protein